MLFSHPKTKVGMDSRCPTLPAKMPSENVNKNENSVNNLSGTSGIQCEASGGMFLAQFIDWLNFGRHASPKNMARILSDREIKKLIGSVIIGANASLINPNGIELRLGNEVRFMSTGEKMKIPAGHF